MDFSIRIAKELNLTVDAVRNTIELLDEGASIPFIARYRKEATGSLNSYRQQLRRMTPDAMYVGR